MKRITSLAALAAALTITACGGSSGGGAASAADKRQDAELKFARCMRQHGVNVPDPTPGRQGPRALRIGGDVSPQVMRRADEACRKYQEAAAPKLTPQQQAEFRDAALKFSKCMRAHGVNVPDPQIRGGGFSIQRRAGAGTAARFNPDSPAFRDANKACEKLLPKPPGAN